MKVSAEMPDKMYLNCLGNASPFSYIRYICVNIPSRQVFTLKTKRDMSKVNIVHVRKIAFTKMRKLDVYNLYNQIVLVVNKHYTKEMHIDNTCELLIASQPKTKLLLDVEFGPHPLSPIIEELREKRFKFTAIITNHMQTVAEAVFSDKEHLMKLVKPVVQKYLSYIRQNDLITVDDLIGVFILELKQNLEIREAFYELGFKPYLDELESTHIEYMDACHKRIELWSKRRKGSTLPLQRELQNILSILFEQVNYYQHVYTDVDYSSFITALNHVIAIYTKLIKTRETQSKNKKLKAKETNSDNLTKELLKGDEKQSIADIEATTNVSLKNAQKNQSSNPSNTKKKEKSEKKDDPSVDGLMNILQKPDKGKDNKEGI